ncbi:metalloregulator ArsR/SmtB family transcription factor [Microbacterium sp. 1P10UB]|uniref:metalloregulator ArsR/SmtB family transcription factor n=1 Tax=unclassified Microbacterium TaxID=2609290 RepID=UPI0039A04C7B
MSTDVASARGVSVLADPTRAAILQLMLSTADGRVLVGRIADTLGLRQPTVSHHMKALLTEGIVTREPSGRQAWYAIAPGHRDRIDALFADEPASSRDEFDLGRIVDNLLVRFNDSIDRASIQRCVTETHQLLRGASHPRLLASRTAAFAADRLEGMVRMSAPHDVPTVLFVCVQNAGRSQIAAAVLRHLAGDRVRVRTAGSAPSADVRSSIVTALDEIGIPLGAEFPKPLTNDAVRAADVVITMGCGDVCATYPGTNYLDWDVDDPVGRPLDEVRAIRDEITLQVRGLLPTILAR